jgi:hypothetical protein
MSKSATAWRTSDGVSRYNSCVPLTTHFLSNVNTGYVLSATEEAIVVLDQRRASGILANYEHHEIPFRNIIPQFPLSIPWIS